MRVLVLSRSAPELEEPLRRGSREWTDVRWDFAPSLRSLPRDLSDVDVLVSFSVPPSLLDRMPRLQWIASTGAGVDRLLTPSLPPHVCVTRLVGPFGRPIAEYVLAAVFADAQDHARAARAQAAHIWEPYYPHDVAGRTAAILGAGAIGCEVGALLRAAGLRVIGAAHSARPAEPPFDRVYGRGQLDNLLRAAEYLVVLVPLTEATRGMIRARELALLPENALVINVARGPVIDEDDLIAALRAGRPRAAVLDVFSREPLPADHVLWTLPNVRLTPHVAGLSRTPDIAAQVLANLARFRADDSLLHVVDRARGY